MVFKDEFFDRGSFIIGIGEKIRFWGDVWLDDQSLSTQYPPVFNIVLNKDVADVNF
jgi:hypothetical protein